MRSTLLPLNAGHLALEPKVITLVLARLTLPCRGSKTSCVALSCRCSPAGVVKMMVRSSAYSGSGTSAPERPKCVYQLLLQAILKQPKEWCTAWAALLDSHQAVKDV